MRRVLVAMIPGVRLFVVAIEQVCLKNLAEYYSSSPINQGGIRSIGGAELRIHVHEERDISQNTTVIYCR